MKFSWKIFFITFLIIITSFGVGGFLLINTVFTNTLNNRIDSAKKNNNYITTALSVYADNNLPTYGNLEYLRVSAIGFAKQIAGNSDSKIKIGSINELSFSAENEFAHGMSVNSRKSRVVTENKKYYIQTISKIQLVTKSCYIETVDNITSVYSDRDMYCTIYQFILIGVALFASILLVIFSKLLTRPLVKLKDASKEVAEGNFNMRVKESHGITSSTEITELSQSFNTMADYVEDYIEQLKLATQNRDNFIADFTHELKTPLTSVIGYADMLRSYEMEPKQRRECADLIYKEGSRLEALSLNLLNLIVLKNDEIKTVNIKTDIIADDIKKSILFILKNNVYFKVYIMENSNKKMIGIIHAALISSKSVQPFIDDIIPDVTVAHVVDDTIQNTNFASKPGVIPKSNFYKFATYAHFLEEAGADLILLACSTFNQAVELARPMINVPLLQIDRPMMDLAVNQGKRIGLLATVPTTIPASERLLYTAAAESGKEIEVTTILCSEAFEAIKRGEIDLHNRLLLNQIDRLSETVDAIVLAQVSMSALEPMLVNTKVPVYNSGRTGFERVKQMLDAL